ncbi:MAG: hypothetical protein ACOX0V_00085 [Bacteroidales bacterium]
MNKLSVILILFYVINLNLVPSNSFCQSNKFVDLERKVDSKIANYFTAITTDDAWRPYENSLDELITQLQTSKKSNQYSFSQEENLLINKWIKDLGIMKLFGDGIAIDGYEMMFNTDTKNKILELFPEITFEFYTSYNNCVSVYKITYDAYVVLVARHTNKNKLYNIGWENRLRNCSSIKGNFNMIPGVYKTFWINFKECPTVKSPSIVITSCDFVMDLTFSPSTVIPDF